MNFRAEKIIFCLLVIMVAILIFSPMEVNAASFTDIRGHWSEAYVERAVDQGFIEGYPDGTFKPDRRVSRAEFISMINRALKNTGTTSISFSDVPSNQWFYKDVSKAVAAAYVKGYSDGTFKPAQTITREEAAFILSRIVPTYGSSGRLNSFYDDQAISSWAYTAMKKINGKGYISGYDDGRIHPHDALTRAQAAKIIGDVLEEETIITSDTVIKKDGTKLSNRIYSNDVRIDDDLDDGSVTIDNCIILGKLTVEGGGEDTITINNSRIVNVEVEKEDSPVRLLAKGETSIVELTGSEDYILETSRLAGGTYGPGFEIVNIKASSNAILDGTFPSVSINGANAHLILESGTINDLNITKSGRRAEVELKSGTNLLLTRVYAESHFAGKGKISAMEVYSKNITYETKPKTWKIGANGSTPKQRDPELTAIFDPKDGETDVYLDTKIKITFSTSVTKANGKSVTNKDIDDIITLRKGSTSGSVVSFSASIDSSKKVITITPSSNLDSKTRYYIIVEDETLEDSYGNENERIVSRFTTGEDTLKLTISFSPADDATGVPVDRKSFTISFSDRVIKYNGSEISSSTDKYLKDSVVVFQKNGSNISSGDYTVSINSSRKTITITSKQNLAMNTKYYIGIKASSLKTEGGTKVPKSGAEWTTAGKPVLKDISVVSYQEYLDVKLLPNVNGNLYLVAMDPSAGKPDAKGIKDGTGALSKANTSVSGNTSKTVQLKNLNRDQDYRIYAVLFDGNGNSSEIESVDAKTKPLLLRDLIVSTSAGNVLKDFDPEVFHYDISVPNGTKSLDVEAIPDADSFTGTLFVNGDSVHNMEVSITDGEASIKVDIQETGKTLVTYTVDIKEAGSAGLEYMTVNDIPYTPGSEFSIGEGVQTVELFIVPVDPRASVWFDDEPEEYEDIIERVINSYVNEIEFKIVSYDKAETRTYKIRFVRQEDN